MGETPKNREEIFEFVARKIHGKGWFDFEDGAQFGVLSAIKDHVEAIEALGLRIVPAELGPGYGNGTKDAMSDAYHDMGDIWSNVYRAAISSSPFAPEEES